MMCYRKIKTCTRKEIQLSITPSEGRIIVNKNHNNVKAELTKNDNKMEEGKSLCAGKGSRNPERTLKMCRRESS